MLGRCSSPRDIEAVEVQVLSEHSVGASTQWALSKGLVSSKLLQRMPGQHIPDSMDPLKHAANLRAPVMKASRAYKALAKFRALTRHLLSLLGLPRTRS